MPNSFFYPFEKDGRLTTEVDSYSKLSEYEKYQLSFHPERPKYLDYLSIFSDVSPCFETEEHGGCILQTHRAQLELEGKKISVMLIGQQTGPTSHYGELVDLMSDSATVRQWNHGMPTPVSYSRAVQAIRAAEEEHRVILTFVDTPGADPTEESEAGGIAWRIGETIRGLIETSMPTIALIINRACSGGAIAITGCDVVLAMEFSTYLVISPEAASSILFRTRARANEAAGISCITSREGLELGIVDQLVPEPDGPAHRNPRKSLESARNVLVRQLSKLCGLSKDELLEYRIKRWAGIGHWNIAHEEEVRSIQQKVSRLPKPNKEGFIKRHHDCRNARGERVYDPVYFSRLFQDNYICAICGYRYTRPSVWDVMELLLDTGSFVEHGTTRFIVDKDILGFPGYPEKLEQTQRETGLMTAMITGNAVIEGRRIVFCGTDFGFLGGSFCMSTGEKIWQAAVIAMERRLPLVLTASGGGARMHEGCSSMVSIPKAHLALTRAERAGLPVITIITDPTLGGVAIGYASRGIRLFEYNAGNIGFSGKRVIEQYTGKKTSSDFQQASWLKKHGHAENIVHPVLLRGEIGKILEKWGETKRI